MRALLSSMVASASQRQTVTFFSEDNLSATQPSKLSSLPGGRFADHATYNWLTVTLAVGGEPLQDQSAQEGSTDSESDYAWMDSEPESEEVDSESEQLQSDSSSPSNIQLEQPDAHLALSDRPEAVVAPVDGVG